MMHRHAVLAVAVKVHADVGVGRRRLGHRPFQDRVQRQILWQGVDRVVRQQARHVDDAVIHRPLQMRPRGTLAQRFEPGFRRVRVHEARPIANPTFGVVDQGYAIVREQALGERGQGAVSGWCARGVQWKSRLPTASPSSSSP